MVFNSVLPPSSALKAGHHNYKSSMIVAGVEQGRSGMGEWRGWNQGWVKEAEEEEEEEEV